MTEKKKHTYNSSVLALPPLKLVIGDVLPDPEGEESRPIRPFVKNKLDHETRKTLRKLIGRIEQTE